MTVAKHLAALACVLALFVSITSSGGEKMPALDGSGQKYALKGNAVNGQQLADLTRRALSDQDVVQNLIIQAYRHDELIGEAIKGDYNLQPEKIVPWRPGDGKAVAVVSAKVGRGG